MAPQIVNTWGWITCQPGCSKGLQIIGSVDHCLQCGGYRTASRDVVGDAPRHSSSALNATSALHSEAASSIVNASVHSIHPVHGHTVMQDMQ